MKEYFKPIPRDRQIARPSRRPFVKEKDYTPLNARSNDILKEVYHLKLLPRTVVQKGMHTVMGKDRSARCAYHKLQGHHTRNYHQLKKEIEILIQRGRLLSYIKYVRGQPEKRSPPQKDPNLKIPNRRKGREQKKSTKPK